MVPSISKKQCVDFFQTAAKIGTIGGSITSLAFVALDYNYTYPCTITALSAYTWFSIWLAQSTQQEDKESENKPIKEIAKEFIFKIVDKVTEEAKKQLKTYRNQFVDPHIAVGKTAVIALTPQGLEEPVAASLELSEKSAKGLSDISIDGCVNATKGIAKSLISRSFNSCS
jgi:hypothetical protein